MKWICLFLLSQCEPAHSQVGSVFLINCNKKCNEHRLLPNLASVLKRLCRTVFKVATRACYLMIKYVFSTSIVLHFRTKSPRSQVSLLNASCHKSGWTPKETLQMDSVWHSWLREKKLRSNLNAAGIKVWFSFSCSLWWGWDFSFYFVCVRNTS